MNGNPEPRAYLDTSVVILLIEGTAATRADIRAEFKKLGADRGRFAVSALTKLECLVKPLRAGDLDLERTYRLFFAGSEIHDAEITVDVWEGATQIRAKYGLRVPDALHLAAATAAKCTVILTRDQRWGQFLEVPVQVL